MSGTMAEKVWRDHIVSKGETARPTCLYIDLHLVHEVTSPQGLRGLAPGRTQGSPPRSNDRDGGSQHADRQH